MDNLNDQLEPRTLWQLDTWRCVFTGTSVQLYDGPFLAASTQVHYPSEIEETAHRWQRSVVAIMQIEAAVDPKRFESEEPDMISN